MDKRDVGLNPDELEPLDSCREPGRGLALLQPQTRPGRPSRLASSMHKTLASQLEKSPADFGLNYTHWDGHTDVAHLKRQFGLTLTVRQAQRWMHQLGDRLKRAGYAYLQAHVDEAKRFHSTLKKLNSLGLKETVVFQEETGSTMHPRLGRG